MAAAIVYYAAIALNGSETGWAGISFLFLTPAFLSAFVCAIADPRGQWGPTTYLKVPPALIALVAVAMVIFMREGLICLVMLALPWAASGMIGTVLFYRLRRRVEGERFHASALLVLPLVLIQAEALVPAQWQERVVARSVDIATPPEDLWPMLLSLRAIAPGEGRWTVSQDLLGVPRPTDAVVRSGDNGPVRYARWQDGVRFEEAITGAARDRALDWRFVFPDLSLQHRVDRHIAPRGPLLDVASGGYRLTRMADGGTRLTLTTRYRMRTWAAPYAALWGELILGDIQRNILGIIADRAAVTGAAGGLGAPR